MTIDAEPTRRYSIDITDIARRKTVVSTVVDMTDEERCGLVAHIMRLGGPPHEPCFIELVAAKRTAKPIS
jgi:hypothetical protein